MASDEVAIWEYDLSSREKLICTNQRLYRITSDYSRITVIFRKSIIGCEYAVKSQWLTAIILIVLGFVSGGIFLYVMQQIWAFWIVFLPMTLLSMCFMFAYEVITIKVSDGKDIPIYKIKYFQYMYQQVLLDKLKDISSLDQIKP